MGENFASEYARHWVLDENIVFMNHGSFGACPAFVLDKQSELRRELESQPVNFFDLKFSELLNNVREILAQFIRCQARNLLFVPNATTAVNTVLRSLEFPKNSEILFTDHTYNACKNAVRYITDRYQVRPRIARFPVPVSDEGQILDALISNVTPATRLTLIDHITSPSALVLPIEVIVEEMQKRGVEVLVDGAHAPGMIDLNIEKIGAAYYTGNCHKWLCAPKGAAFLHIRSDKQEEIHPLTISHGYGLAETGCKKVQAEFDWTGTDDPTAILCIPESIHFMEHLVKGGWNQIRKMNHDLALTARDILKDTSELQPVCPDSMIGSMASFILPIKQDIKNSSLFCRHPVQVELLEKHRIEVPFFQIPDAEYLLIRISAQLYNSEEQYRYLGQALGSIIHQFS